MSNNPYTPVMELTRGSVVESIHFGAVAVVDSDGNLLAEAGNPSLITFLRSAAKPFQALPFIEIGGAEHFHLDDSEVALLCASHSGTDAHLDAINRMQAKIGIQEKDLQCGTHPPMDEATGRALIRAGMEPTPNRHMCSGKHSGMLGQALLRHLPLENYIDPNSELQQFNLRAFSEMCRIPANEMEVGIDGCSAPNYAVPLRNAALAYARLVDPQGVSASRTVACLRIAQAMAANPWQVGGPGRLDTALMQTAPGLVSKSGAEGFQAVAVPPGFCGVNSHGIGIALKVSDGDLTLRATSLVAIHILHELGFLSPDQLEALAGFYTRPVLNWRRLAVGETRPAFHLIRHNL